MKILSKLMLLLMVMTASAVHAQSSIYRFTVKDYEGNDYPLRQDSGKVMLIVNTATQCGFTPQYKQLESIYEKYKDKGFVILDFPCNQFNEQAPGTSGQIHTFCTGKYGISFPQMDKVEVNGAGETPLYSWLKSQSGFRGFGKGLKAMILKKLAKKRDKNYKDSPDIKWNFTKFLINRQGKVLARYEPNQDMEEVEKAVAEALTE